MKRLSAHITIGKYRFDWVNSVEIESAWKMFTDTAVIKLPAHLKINRDELLNYFKYGDRVIIRLGYDDRLQMIFAGFITEIKPSVPIEIKCEDEMWWLKQDNITYSGKRLKLSDLINELFADYKTDYIDVSIGNYYIKNLSRAKILEKLKSDFGLYSFFRGNTLVIGKVYNPDTANEHKFKLDYNVVENDLIYKRKDEVKLKVKAISNKADGSKIEIELGDENGEQRTLNFYDLDKVALKKYAEAELERLKYDGWRGSFTAFGEPFVRHGDIVELQKEGHSDQTGKYWVDKVVYSFGTDGYRQKITLGSRL